MAGISRGTQMTEDFMLEMRMALQSQRLRSGIMRFTMPGHIKGRAKTQRIKVDPEEEPNE